MSRIRTRNVTEGLTAGEGVETKCDRKGRMQRLAVFFSSPIHSPFFGGSMRTMRSSIVVALMLLGSFQAGCAAMFSGTSETIYLRSEEPGTMFLANERELGTGTSAVTSISKKDLGDTTLRAVKAGCSDRVSPIPTSFDAITLLGLFLDFGLISIVVIDWLATGAVNKAAQSEYVLTPTCTPAGNPG